jgi:Aldehyde dehydrogenase family
MTRVPVKKTYKLFVGGAFPRSESGRTYEAEEHNIAQASRKDLRDAVRVARGALPKWAGMTAYNRGQVLYRVAEMMEARGAELAELCEGREEVDSATDRVVWYAGWTDKLAQVLGGANPVAGPYFNFTMPEPTGVVGILAPSEPALLGLVSRLAPVLAGGNVAVVVASEAHPRAAPGRAGAAPGLAPRHRRARPRRLRRRPRARRGRQRQAGGPRARRRAEPVRDLRLPGAQDGLAPHGAVARAACSSPSSCSG